MPFAPLIGTSRDVVIDRIASIVSVAQILAAASTAISHSTARGATSHPATPAAMAVNTLPAWSNASFRPIRRVNILGPTMPSEMAAIADGNTASALPMAAWLAMRQFGKKRNS